MLEETVGNPGIGQVTALVKLAEDGWIVSAPAPVKPLLDEVGTSCSKISVPPLMVVAPV